MIYAQFDNLMLMMEGRIIYQGSAKEAPAYFDKIGHQIDKNTNPADYYMKHFYVPYKKSEEEILKFQNLNDKYQS